MDARPQESQDPRVPQIVLRDAIKALRESLGAAQNTVSDPDATVASINQAMTSLAQAQQAYNAAVIRIPMRMMKAVE